MSEAKAMITLHPQIINKGDKKEFVVLPYEEWMALQEVLEDAQDLLDLREAKREEGDALTIPLQAVKQQLGLA